MRPPTFDPGRLASLDLTSPAVHAEYDLSEVWRHLRDEQPLYRHPPTRGHPGYWVVTRHADVTAVFRDGQRFGSMSGNVLETLLAGGDSASGKMLAVTDGSRHLEVRRVITGVLTPALLDRLADRIGEHVRRLVADVLAAGECDFGQDVAAEVPLTIICDLLAVPDADRPYIHRLGSSSVSSHGPGHGTMNAWTSKNELLAYFLDLAEQRRADPGDDLVSVLTTARVKGRPLSTDEIVLNCYSLILGGDETTRLAMTGGVEALADNPAAWRAFRAGEVDIGLLVEEVLRWTTPSRHLGRLALEPADLAGGRVEAGDVVTAWIASANFDEREFTAPGEFRVDRTPNRHLTFAYGAHFCLGARLARIQLEAAFTALRGLVAEIEVTGQPRRVYSNFIGGTFTLPVRLEAASGSGTRARTPALRPASATTSSATPAVPGATTAGPAGAR